MSTFAGSTSSHSGQCHFRRVLHIAGPSPPGTSGGCWVDEFGQVVASQSGFIDFGGHTGIAWAAPAAPIRQLLATREDARTPTLGVPVEELVEQHLGALALRKVDARERGQSTVERPPSRAELAASRA